ncbi:MAG: glutathione ABC transporter permease [Deltaproteobacteria bacterium RBG_16_48_10]|nr:MAG: glutathione ABC transporter permease [Deltaproteobacteria bacterium RBG_16_48_10]
MFGYAIRRILLSIPILLAVLTIVFLSIRVLPGDPAAVVLGDYASKAALDKLRKTMGIDKPLTLQYIDFLKGLVQGDFGKSMITGAPVVREIVRALPYTLELTLTGIVLGLMIGVPLGIITALHRNRFIDYMGRTFSLIGQSFPSFYLGLLLMLLFSIKLKLFPIIGGGDLTDLKDTLYHLFLPGITMGMIMAAYMTRMSRSVMLNVLNEDYIRTARAKGLKESIVIYKHALKNILIPIISITGVYSIVLIGGSIMVEIIFSRPGLGKIMIGAMMQRDYIALQSTMAIYSVFVVILNLITDLAYGLVDPRIKY